MRVLAANVQDDFRVKAYAGTNGVLLAMDLAERRRKGLLGFAIEKQQGDKPWLFLFNSLTFPDEVHHLSPVPRHPQRYRAFAEISLGRLRGQSGRDDPLPSSPGLRQPPMRRSWVNSWR